MHSAKKTISVVVLCSLLFSTNYSIGLGAMLPTAPKPLLISEDAFNLPDAKVGTGYEYQFQSEGGLAPLTWKVVTGQLPPGLQLESGGKLHGKPTQAQRNGYAFLVEVTDSSPTPQSARLPVLLMVQAAPLRIITTSGLKIITNQTTSARGANGSTDGATSPTNGTNNPNGRNVPQLENVSPPSSTTDGLQASLDGSGNAAAVTAAATATTTAAGGNARAILSPAQPAAAPAATPTPTPCTLSGCVEQKYIVCGRLRPASMDETIALIRSVPIFRGYIEVAEAELRVERAAGRAKTESQEIQELQKVVTEAKKRAVEQLRQINQKDKISGENNKDKGRKGSREEKEFDYLTDLWKRVAKSRFTSDVDCRTQDVITGAQKAAVVELFHWVLKQWKEDGVANGIKEALRDSSSHLTPEIIRKQIILLNQFTGNIRVIVKKKDAKEDDAIANTQSDDDGNFIMSFNLPGSAPANTNESAGNDVYVVSSEADNHHTKREIKFFDDCKCYKLDLRIEDRPPSLLTRAVVGYQQAGAAASEVRQNYFLDLFISQSLPWQQSMNPDFGEKFKAWTAVRTLSVRQSGEFKLGDFSTSLVSGIANTPAKDAVRVVDALGGIEMRLTGNSGLLPSFDRDTKQKFSLSLIAGLGFTTPTEPKDDILKFKIPDQKAVEGLPKELQNAADVKRLLELKKLGYDNVALIPDDRDRFFRQYFAGLRIQAFFFNRYNMPLQRFPAQFDFSIGQNEYVSGGRLHGPVFRVDGYFPLPFDNLQYINLYGTALLRLSSVRTGTPLILEPVLDAQGNLDNKFPAANTAVLPVHQFDRDYYKIGVGFDFISFIKKVKDWRTSNASATTTPTKNVTSNNP